MLPEQAQFLSATENGRTLLKYLTASAIITMNDLGALPFDDVESVRAAAALVLEASARDGLQPIFAKATPILAKLAEQGKKLAGSAG